MVTFSVVPSGRFDAHTLIAASDSNTTHQNIAEYVCTGTNDQITIQNAIDNATDGDTLYFLNGTYNLTPATSLGEVLGIGSYDEWNMACQIDKGLKLTGDPGAEIKLVNGSITPTGPGVTMFLVYGDGGTTVSNLRVDGLNFNGNKPTLAPVHNSAFFLKTPDTLWIENNLFEHGSYHIWGDMSKTGENFHINQNTFKCNYWNGMALHNGGKNSEIRGNIFQSPLQGLLIDTCEEVIVAGNIFTDVTSTSSSPSPPNGIALYIYDSVYNCIFNNNLITTPKSGKTPWGIYAYTEVVGSHKTCDYNLYQNNYITAWGNGTGIYLNGEGNIVKGNVFRGLTGTVMDDQGTNTITEDNIGLE